MTDEEPKAEIPQLLSPRLPVFLVDNNAELEKYIEVLSKANVLAIDAERASGFRYGQKAYLIQVALEDVGIYLLDTVPNYDETLANNLRTQINSKTWIIHAASQDIPCLSEYGFHPVKILDTELAGRLLGYPKVSLGVLCEQLLGFSLAKEHSAVDWSERPLPQAWLNYAALDVDVLFELWSQVDLALSTANKKEIAEEEFEFLTKPLVKEPKIDRWRSVTGIHEIKDQRQLTIVRALWQAREELAREKDVSPGRLVPDQSLVAAVKASPRSKSELASLRSFSGRASRTYLDLWWAAYEKGNQTHDLAELRVKSTGIPNHRNWPSKFPEANIRLQWAKRLLKGQSEKLEIPVENLITPEIVRTICFSPEEFELNPSQYLKSRLVRNWQIDEVVPVLLEAVAKSDLPPAEETTA